ncbi:hypothetical protein RRSWK_04720 [Rhodopirellula sp. SWK7]|nr:hypothetical protein RRSWK_04720 [Rhodopirellula sp. SWK7]
MHQRDFGATFCYPVTSALIFRCRFHLSTKMGMTGKAMTDASAATGYAKLP